MCYNCGCEEPDNPMGKDEVKGASLTSKSFEEMAKAWGMSVEETEENVRKLLNKKYKTA